MSLLPPLGSSRRPLVVQVLASLLGAVLVITLAFTMESIVLRNSRMESNESRSAVLASQIEASVLQIRALVPAATPAGATFTPRQVLSADDTLSDAEQKSDQILQLIGTPAALEIWGATSEAHSALNDYLDNPTIENRTSLYERLDAMDDLVGDAVPALSQGAEAHQSTLVSTALLARAVMVAASALAVLVISITAVIIGRRLSVALTQAQREKENLSDLTATINKRSDQLAALYQVVTEITDTLSLKYVVNTTINEAQKLVNADLVALRLLRGDMLELVGVVRSSSMTTVPDLKAMTLGTGIVGRSAQRGKSFRVDSGAEHLMDDAERVEGVQSGVVVPLIVGAKVVGTLGCWSRTQSQFSPEDERILEMMASQVATAVVAAELHEDTSQQAHHDALTGLPNRRQLTADMSGYVAELMDREESFALVMVDIDHFKHFNDEFGHKVGDVTLQKVADVLRVSMRDTDRIYRFGGEEFVLVLAGVEEADARIMLERVRKSVQQTPLTGDRLEPVGPLTVSMGVALHPAHGRLPDELIKLADLAMYQAKQAGRNRVVFAGAITEQAAAA